MGCIIIPQNIYCDEAGFTGDRLLDAQQTMFTYATVAMDPDEAQEIVAKIRSMHGVAAKELKGSKLAKSRRGRAAILDALKMMRGRYLVTAYDKKYVLACKFFEYVFEPVLAGNNRVFYENNFHKFIATLVYVNFICKEANTVLIVNQFERFMRTLNPNDAPLIFSGVLSTISMQDSLEDIALFIDGYRAQILQESNYVGNWVLDLSISALWTHLASWGEHFEILDVLCDDSKPLRHFGRSLDAMVNRPERKRVRMYGKDRPVTFNLAKSVKFGSSSEEAGLQLADIISSAILQAFKHRNETWSTSYLLEMESHIHEDCILPDVSYMDPATPSCAVNTLILRELGQRASEGRDPLQYIEEWYSIGHMEVNRFVDVNTQRINDQITLPDQ